jgi:hypothetical protein
MPPPPNVPVKVIDARPPFPLLWTLSLSAIPRPGDLINIGIKDQPVSYKVSFVNFDPYDNVAHVTLGCVPNQIANGTTTENETALKQRMEDFIKSQLQLFDKAESYSKALILLGFAGTFGVWNFAKDVMSARATATTATLVGSSLLIYISFEIIAMIYRAQLQHKFNKLIHNSPSDFFVALERYNTDRRLAMVRDFRAWAISLVATLFLGYVGVMLILYNCLAKLTGLPPWP